MHRRTFLGAVGMTATATLWPASQSQATDQDEGGELMPTFFIGHGSPLNAVEDNRFTSGWKNAMKDVPPPKAIVCVSAHWLTLGTYVTAVSRLRTFHPDGVASRDLTAIRYPAPGSPALAGQIASAVQSTSVGLDYHWGLDQATWSVLRQTFPKADIPVVQMSIDPRQPGIWHYNLGRELLYLRRRGVLVIGIGNIVHNLHEGDLQLAYEAFDWAIEADEIVKAKIRAGDHAGLCEYEMLGRSVSLAIPTPEHYYPLLYVLGMQTPEDKVKIFNDALAFGCVTMTSVRLGA